MIKLKYYWKLLSLLILLVMVMTINLKLLFFAHYLQQPPRMKYVVDDEDADSSGGSMITASSSSSSSSEGKQKQQNSPQLPTISLVTNFWADKEDDEQENNNKKQRKRPSSSNNPHRVEILAAIQSNMENPYIDQVVIVLDSTTPNNNCTHFVQSTILKKMNVSTNSTTRKTASDEHNKNHHEPATTTKSKPSKSKLTCIDRNINQGQPTYYEMFHYAISDDSQTIGDIVIVANADQVFDETIQMAKKKLSNWTVAVLTTHGFPRQKIPSNILDSYMTNVLHHKDLFERQDKHKLGIDRCGTGIASWDSYMFHKRTLQKYGHLRPNQFRRQLQDGSYRSFYMNEPGAENAALYELTKNLRLHFGSNDTNTTTTKTKTKIDDDNNNEELLDFGLGRNNNNNSNNESTPPLLPHSSSSPSPSPQQQKRLKVINACKWIHSWHFHLAPKTHRKSKTLWNHTRPWRVPPPTAKPTDDEDEDEDGL